jgi:hypothetical protein
MPLDMEQGCEVVHCVLDEVIADWSAWCPALPTARAALALAGGLPARFAPRATRRISASHGRIGPVSPASRDRWHTLRSSLLTASIDDFMM